MTKANQLCDTLYCSASAFRCEQRFTNKVASSHCTRSPLVLMMQRAPTPENQSSGKVQPPQMMPWQSTGHGLHFVTTTKRHRPDNERKRSTKKQTKRPTGEHHTLPSAEQHHLNSVSVNLQSGRCEQTKYPIVTSTRDRSRDTTESKESLADANHCKVLHFLQGTNLTGAQVFDVDNQIPAHQGSVRQPSLVPRRRCRVSATPPGFHR